MKRLLFLGVVSSAFILFACNNSDDKKTDTATPPEETVVAATSIPAASFKVIMLQHKVKDFPAWKAEYMSHDSMRQLYGVTHLVYGRSTEDSNMVIVIDKITEGQKAKDFADLPKLKENMKKAGVIGVPVVSFADVVRQDDSKTELKDRLMVIHNVKDFNTWLKVYDGEGMNTRKENGLIDRGLARDMDDPNKVYIVFAISDMEKAKNRIASEELKKIMTDAGVEGAPQLLYYRVGD